MKTFLLILFFSKTVLLTPFPISFVGEYDFDLEKPAIAITAGANIEINITKFIGEENIKNKDILEKRNLIGNKIAENTVIAILYNEDGDKVMLDEFGISISKDSVALALYAKGGMPTGIKYTNIKIISKIELRDVEISWNNFQL